jgi:transcriptional regulator with XRE-family HTH domain
MKRPDPTPKRPEIEAAVEAQRQFITSILDARGITRTALARMAGLAQTTITRVFLEEANPLSGRTVARIAAAAGVPIPSGVAATMPARIDREVLWRAFELATRRVSQPLFGPRRWPVVIDVTAIAYDFLVERREAGFDITNTSESLAAADFIVRQEVDRRRNQ